MASSPNDQQPTFLLWVATVLFCNRNYKQAMALIAAEELHLNGQVAHNLLQLVGSGDSLAWQNNLRVVDLDALRKAHALRRQMEMFLGGPEVAYKHLGAATMPSTPPE